MLNFEGSLSAKDIISQNTLYQQARKGFIYFINLINFQMA